jgi:hypothetical protein
MHDTGFRVVRRRLLWLPAWAAAAFVGGPAAALAGDEGAGALAWDEFAKLADAGAQPVSNGGSAAAYDAYLFALATYAARLRLESIPRAKVGAFGSLKPHVSFGVATRGAAFVVVEWQMEPGAVLPPHNHPNYSVCTLGVEGEARVRHYEPVGAAPDFASKDAFRVRETRDDLVEPGRISTLSPTRDNIHTFRAGEKGARGVDITTRHGKDAGFSFLAIDDRPADADARVYAARWRPLP